MIRRLLTWFSVGSCQEHADGYICFVCRFLGAKRERTAMPPRAASVAAAQPVHHCLWSSQPDLLIACDHSWTTPKWGNAQIGVEGVYSTDDGRLYSFDESLTTCTECLETLSDPVKRERAGNP